MDLYLDPDVVLYHLRCILGENISISEDQLLNFIHDLKKLIRRDQKERKNKSENTSVQEDEEKQEEPNLKLCSCHNFIDSTSYEPSNISFSESCAVSVDDNMDIISKPTESARVQSAFIKPWRLNVPPRSNITSGRTDPVQLYQQYQEQWKNFRVPGEYGHNQTRWTVRERMLGQDPQPREEIGASSPCRCHEFLKSNIKHCVCPDEDLKLQWPSEDAPHTSENLNKNYSVKIKIYRISCIKNINC